MESSSFQLANGNIKKIISKVILKKILSHLYINKKLDLIAYNKQLQNKLGFNIEDYKDISKKYKIVTNGIIKEYLLNTDFLIFLDYPEKYNLYIQYIIIQERNYIQ